MIYASGLFFLYKNSVLLLKRTNNGLWGFPGGHTEVNETPWTGAVRECREETGYEVLEAPKWSVRQRHDDVEYTSFYIDLPAPFTPVLNDEHSEFGWFPIEELPENCHQGIFDVISRLSLDELGVARYIAEGKFTSPQRYCNVWLFSIRITGTGVAYRGGEGEGEFSFRPVHEWVTDDFLQRCNGLPVVLDHPPKSVLDSEEFSKRIVGSIFYPFEKNDEVWGVAKIFDEPTAEMLVDSQWSTSPGVIVGETERTPLQSGETLLYEGKPFLLDHIAICRNGVWDKYAGPSGVDTTIQEGNMAEHEEDRRDTEEVKSVEAVGDNSGEEKMEEKQGADDGKSLDDLYAKLEKIMGLIEGAKADEEDECEDEFIPGEPLNAEADESEEEAEEHEAEGGRKANEELEGERREEERMKKDRRDAEIEEMRRKLDAVNERTREISDEERNQISDAQSKCDSVANMFGEQSPRPLSGESALAYRRRAVSKFQRHSDEWKNTSLAKLDSAVFDIAERQIYADAVKAVNAPAAVNGISQSRAIKERNDAGHTVTRFVGGRPRDWMGDFRG